MFKSRSTGCRPPASLCCSCEVDPAQAQESALREPLALVFPAAACPHTHGSAPSCSTGPASGASLPSCPRCWTVQVWALTTFFRDCITARQGILTCFSSGRLGKGGANFGAAQLSLHGCCILRHEVCAARRPRLIIAVCGCLGLPPLIRSRSPPACTARLILHGGCARTALLGRLALRSRARLCCCGLGRCFHLHCWRSARWTPPCCCTSCARREPKGKAFIARRLLLSCCWRSFGCCWRA